MILKDSIIILDLVKDLNGLMIQAREKIQDKKIAEQLKEIDWKVNTLFTTLVVQALTNKDDKTI